MGWLNASWAPWLLLLLPAGALLWLVYSRTSKLIPAWFAAGTYGGHRPGARFILRAVGLGFACLALLGPYFSADTRSGDVLGHQVYFLLDLSGSMNAEDIRPSRLTKAREEIRKTIEKLKGEQMGLIVFTDLAFVQCPLTDDYQALLLYLDILETGLFSNSGTDFRQALTVAYNQFAAEQNARERRVSQCIVLVSDGENHSEKFASVIGKIRDAGMQVVSVGVGSSRGARVPTLDRDGNKVGYKKDSRGLEVLSQRQDETLQSIARKFGTQYMLLANERDNLNALPDIIRAQPASIVASRSELTKLNRYSWLLLPALLCWALSMFLMPYRISKEGVLA